jgi:ferrous iron transport protein A
MRSPIAVPVCERLDELPVGARAVVRAVRGDADTLGPDHLRRLGELGFLPGEPVHLLRRGPGGREPLAVQIGDTLFALRRAEARAIEVERTAEPAAA